MELVQKESHNLLEEWQTKAHEKRLIHLKATQFYMICHQFFGISTIILSAIVSMVSASAYFKTHTNDQFWLSVVVNIGSLLVTIFSTVQHFMAFSKKQYIHMSLSNQFAVLCNTIDRYLITEITPDIVKQTCNQYNKIVERSVEVPSCVVSSVKKSMNSIQNDNSRLIHVVNL